MEDRMKRRFVPVVIVGSMVLLAGLNSRPAHSEPPPACASGAEGDAAKVAATQILQSLMAAYEKLKRDFGDDILSSRKAEIDTPQGTRTIGQVWSEYLKQTGYPAFAVRQQCAKLLASAGLSDTATTILVMAPANYDGIEDLAAGLKKIATKAQ
jgi:hypothetical protein